MAKLTCTHVANGLWVTMHNGLALESSVRISNLMEMPDGTLYGTMGFVGGTASIVRHTPAYGLDRWDQAHIGHVGQEGHYDDDGKRQVLYYVYDSNGQHPLCGTTVAALIAAYGQQEAPAAAPALEGHPIMGLYVPPAAADADDDLLVDDADIIHYDNVQAVKDALPDISVQVNPEAVFTQTTYDAVVRGRKNPFATVSVLTGPYQGLNIECSWEAVLYCANTGLPLVIKDRSLGSKT